MPNFVFTGVPGEYSSKKARVRANGVGPRLASRPLDITHSYISVLPVRGFHPASPFCRLSTPIVRVPPSLALPALVRSLVTKGARAPWPRRPINSLQRGCVSRTEPSTGPSKPTFGPYCQGRPRTYPSPADAFWGTNRSSLPAEDWFDPRRAVGSGKYFYIRLRRAEIRVQ